MADEPTGDDATETDAPFEAAEPDAPSEVTEPQAAVETDASRDAGGADAEEPTNNRDRPGVFIPRGVAILIGALLLIGLIGGGGFALGRSTADDDHDRDHRAALPFEQGGRNGQPNGNGNGNGNNGSGNGRPELPFNVQPAPAAGAFLGVRIDDASGDPSGAAVLAVSSDSPASKAGLEAGDVITKVDGDDVTDARSLVLAIADHDSGDSVTITFVRDGDTKTVDVTLGDPSDNATPRQQPSSPS